MRKTSEQENLSGVTESDLVSINKSSLVLVGLGILFVIAAVQTWQLTSLINQANNQQVFSTTTIAATTSAVAAPAQAAAPPTNNNSTVPDNLKNLPSQVGGC